MNSIIDLIRDNPDDQRIYNFLALGKSPDYWKYTVHSGDALGILGLNKDIYSHQYQRTPLNYLLDKESKTGRSCFPCEDRKLSKFLFHSLSKQDILKPYGNQNVRTIGGAYLYHLENSVVIASPISIAVLDSTNRIVRECSHNCPETLLKWYQLNKPTALHLEQAVLASVQQTFNLGHWFIDSFPLISLATKHDPSLLELPFLIDTVDHPLIKQTMRKIGLSNIYPTLPFSVYEVKNLFVPKICNFYNRVNISSCIIKELFQAKTDISQQVRQVTASTKIYLSRQHQVRRRILNGDEVEMSLKSRGYQVIHPETLAFDQVASIISEADVIVAPNGAALCNILFSSNNTRVGVIYPESHIDDYYYRVTMDLGLDFFGILSMNTNDNVPLNELINHYYYPSVSSDFHVNLDRLNQLLDDIES